jgi:hypothetical protein
LGLTYLILSDGPVCSTRWVSSGQPTKLKLPRLLDASDGLFGMLFSQVEAIGVVYGGGVKGEVKASSAGDV